MHVYTTEETLRQEGLWAVVERADRSTSPAPTSVGRYQVRFMFDDMNHWYFTWSDEAIALVGYELPEPIARLAMSFTFKKSGIWIGKREPGIYRHGAATAEIQFDTKSEVWQNLTSTIEAIHIFRITGSNLKDCQELYWLLMEGQIRPETNWLQPQMPAPNPEG